MAMGRPPDEVEGGARQDAAQPAADQDDQDSLVSRVATTDPLSVDDATRLTGQIKVTIENVSYQLDVLADLVAKAKAGDVHVVLGYKSWTAYIADVVDGCSLRLDREDRRELVARLSAEGMSARAIGPVVGASEATVRRDIPPASSDAPAREIIGRDGKTYTVTPRPEPQHITIPSTLDGAVALLNELADEREALLYLSRLGDSPPDPAVVDREERINGNDRVALRGRWEFGHEMLVHRDSKGHLPKGFLTYLAGRTGKSRTEIRYRMLFAERFPTDEEFRGAVDVLGDWQRIVDGVLREVPISPVPRRSS
jgi:hypothetical protein